MNASHHLTGAVGRARSLRRRMTLPEKLLWAELRKLDLNIRRQAPIGRYVADFAHHASCLVIEIDSARHDLPEDQLYDLERTAWLESQGYRVLRFRNADVIADAVGIANQVRIAIVPPKAKFVDSIGLIAAAQGGDGRDAHSAPLPSQPSSISQPRPFPHGKGG